MALLHCQPVTGAGKQKQVKRQLQGLVQQKLLAVGDQLPSLRVLAEQFAVHRNTVYGALMALVAEGWLTVEAGRGFFVSGDSRVFERMHKAPLAPHLVELMQPRSYHAYDVRSGTSDMRLFDLGQFKRHFNRAVNRMTARDFEYGMTAGHPRLIEVLLDFLARTRHIGQRPMLVTNGAIEAFQILVQILLQPGDKVAMTALSYPVAREVFVHHGVEVVPIQMQAGGIDCEDLERQIQRHKIRLLYLTPLYHYPTTVTMSLANRAAVLALAERYQVQIIEDDYAHEFYYEQPPLPSLASLDVSGRVFYVSSFSKVLLPAVRIGFVLVPERYYAMALVRKRLISHQNEVFMQLTIAEMVASGYFERHFRQLRKLIWRRRDALVQTLQAYDGVKFDVPMGGLALWLQTGEKTKAILASAKKHEIAISTNADYAIDRHAALPLDAVRIGFARHQEAELARIIHWLFEWH